MGASNNSIDKFKEVSELTWSLSVLNSALKNSKMGKKELKNLEGVIHAIADASLELSSKNDQDLEKLNGRIKAIENILKDNKRIPKNTSNKLIQSVRQVLDSSKKIVFKDISELNWALSSLNNSIKNNDKLDQQQVELFLKDIYESAKNLTYSDTQHLGTTLQKLNKLNRTTQEKNIDITKLLEGFTAQFTPSAAPFSSSLYTTAAPVEPEPERKTSAAEFEKIKNSIKKSNLEEEVTLNSFQLKLQNFIISLKDIIKVLEPVNKTHLAKNILLHYKENKKLYTFETLRNLAKCLNDIKFKDNDQELEFLKKEVEIKADYSFQVIKTAKFITKSQKTYDSLGHFKELQEINKKINELRVELGNLDFIDFESLNIKGQINKLRKRKELLLKDRAQPHNQQRIQYEKDSQLHSRESLIDKVSEGFTILTALSSASIVLEFASIPETPRNQLIETYNSEVIYLEAMQKTQEFIERLKTNPDIEQADVKELEKLTQERIQFSKKFLILFESSLSEAKIEGNKLISFNSIEVTKIFDFMRMNKTELFKLVVLGRRGLDLSNQITEQVETRTLESLERSTENKNLKKQFRKELDKRYLFLAPYQSNDPLAPPDPLNKGYLPNLTITTVQRAPRYESLFNAFANSIKNRADLKRAMEEAIKTSEEIKFAVLLANSAIPK